MRRSAIWMGEEKQVWIQMQNMRSVRHGDDEGLYFVPRGGFK